MFFQVLKSSLAADNVLDYVDKACLFRAQDLVRSAIKFALEDSQVAIADDEWTRLAKKHPELAVELTKYGKEK